MGTLTDAAHGRNKQALSGNLKPFSFGEYARGRLWFRHWTPSGSVLCSHARVQGRVFVPRVYQEER